MSFRVDSGAELLSREGNWNSLSYDEAYEGFLAVSTESGSRLSLRFTGTSVAVYGWISPNVLGLPAPVSRYWIDGQQVGEYAAFLRETSQNGVVFYRSPRLSGGPHTITVESLTNQSLFAVDYFEVNGEPAPGSLPGAGRTSTASSSRTLPTSRPSTSGGPSSSSPASSTVSSASSSLPSESAVPADIDSNDPSFSAYATLKLPPGSPQNGEILPTGISAGQHHHRQTPPLGAIIGGAIGGLAVIAILILVTIYLHKRRRERTFNRLGDPNQSHISLTSPPNTVHPNVPSINNILPMTSLPTSPISSPFNMLSEKAASSDDLDNTVDSELARSLTAGTSSPASTAITSSRSPQRDTMHTVRTTQTSGTALPQYEYRFSNVDVPSDPPPAYQA